MPVSDASPGYKDVQLGRGVRVQDMTHRTYKLISKSPNRFGHVVKGEMLLFSIFIQKTSVDHFVPFLC